MTIPALAATSHHAPWLAQDTAGFRHMSTFYDARHRALWYYMHAQPRACFTPALLDELKQFRDRLTCAIDNPNGLEVRYAVLAARTPGVFNLGGDLALFRRCVATQNRGALEHYARDCIDLLWAQHHHLHRDITTIALVQGDALGGGFEAALASDVLIAERGARLGLPEILFNLFPGMGAFNLLARRIGPAQAERLILSGKTYTAEELHGLGIVDILAEDGKGEIAVYNHIRQESRAFNAARALRKVKDLCAPIPRAELAQVAQLWVDTALKLEKKDLRVMDRLIRRQTRKTRAGA